MILEEKNPLIRLHSLLVVVLLVPILDKLSILRFVVKMIYMVVSNLEFVQMLVKLLT